jgi:sulfur relay (sulfurtransferase) complex TusBCD TusD component (DsrE family)
LENNDKKVENIKNEIKTLTENIKEIQITCTHDQTKLKYLEEEKRVVKICVNCEKRVGYPTNEELKENGYL